MSNPFIFVPGDYFYNRGSVTRLLQGIYVECGVAARSGIGQSKDSMGRVQMIMRLSTKQGERVY